MKREEIEGLLLSQRKFFAEGHTLSMEYRLELLRNLKKAVHEREEEIEGALKEDLGKSSQEAYMCEVGLALSEISHMLTHAKGYAKERRRFTPLAQYVSRSFTKPSPYGNVLIMSPWNYPFLLTIDPLVDAIAAGNTALVKPSAYSPATSRVMKDLMEEVFPPEVACVVTGGREENQALLDLPFDMIFFTGSQAVGKEVLRRAAEHLTPAVLELGGKSPCIVDASADIPLTARRLVWGKYLNLGQTCVAPDYVLCEEGVHEALLTALKKEILRQFGSAPLENPDYGRIINEKHYRRVMGLIQANPEKVVIGGEGREETRQIAPTVMDHVSFSDAVMGEEIFGPVLPIVSFEGKGDTAKEVLSILEEHQKQKPLAFYVFSKDKAIIEKLLQGARFGGGCVNDTVIHLATSQMGFGGVGESGMGAYHGKVGFEAFSHQKSIVDKKTWLDLPMRYQPFTRLHDRMIRWFVH
ncbi:MAG: aldehyde dehydrogenase [Blautia sp.]|nr:aldehyde dehydrogenase [Blautia sp.]